MFSYIYIYIYIYYIYIYIYILITYSAFLIHSIQKSNDSYDNLNGSKIE